LTGDLESVLPVLMLLVQGVSHCNIAAKVYITEGTVKNPVSHILAKLQAEYRTRAADLARRYGLV
jgi:DNA-binding NarL/FixJ family response regulator